MSTARDEILGRIRAAGRAEPASAPRAYRRSAGWSREQTVERFCERVADYKAEIRRIAAADVAVTAADVLAAHSAARIGIPPGLPAAWRLAGVELVEDTGLSPHELDALDGVLTGCTVAVAETGSIVLAAAPADGRRALTLVPDLHVCVVGENQVVGLLPEAIERLGPIVASERRPLTFVSGPSATSDIELDRVEGVHGPRTLVVLVTA